MQKQSRAPCRKFIFSFFGKTCVAFVGLALLFYIMLGILAQSSLNIVQALPLGQFLLLLLTAALLNGAAYLLRLPLPKAVCILLNYIACILSLFITFAASGKLVANNASNALVFLVLFSFFYGLYWGIFLLARFLLFPEKRREKSKKEKQREAEYVNRF